MHRIPNNTSEIQSPCVHSDHTSLRQDDAVSRCFDKMTLNRRGFHGLLLVKVFEQGLRVVFDPRVFRRYVVPGDADIVQDGVTVVTSGSRRSDWLATVMIMMMMTWCYVTWYKTTNHLHSDASRNYDWWWPWWLFAVRSPCKVYCSNMASHSTAQGSHRYRVIEDSVKNNRGIGRQTELMPRTVLYIQIRVPTHTTKNWNNRKAFSSRGIVREFWTG